MSIFSGNRRELVDALDELDRLESLSCFELRRETADVQSRYILLLAFSTPIVDVPHHYASSALGYDVGGELYLLAVEFAEDIIEAYY